MNHRALCNGASSERRIFWRSSQRSDKTSLQSGWTCPAGRTVASVLCAANLLWGLCLRAQTPVASCSEDDFLAAVSVGGLIVFTQDCSITLSGPVVIATNTTIDSQGYNVTLSGENQVFLFDVRPGVSNFTLASLSIAGGWNTNGGAIYINSNSIVTLTNCSVSGNSATNNGGTDGAIGADGSNNGQSGSSGTGGFPSFGGAIYNLGSLVVLQSQFGSNSVLGGNGGVGGNGGNGSITGGNGGDGGSGAVAWGGAIYSLGPLTASNSTFAGNSANGGSGSVAGTGGTGSYNGRPGNGGSGASGSGAAIYSAGYAVIVNCTFQNNAAKGGNSQTAGTRSNGNGNGGPNGGDSLGGGLLLAGGGAITNCSCTGNSVTGGIGGNGGAGSLTGGIGGNGGNGFGAGIYNSGSRTSYVVNCTLNFNSSLGGTNGSGGSAAYPGTNGQPGLPGGSHVANGAGSSSFVLLNSLLGTNLTGNALYGPVSGGYNLYWDTNITITTSNSLRTNDIRVGPLADNGGPTLTFALLTNSLAIRAGKYAYGPPSDQRGVPRPAGTNDIGAYQYTLKPAIFTQPSMSQTQAVGGVATFSVVARGQGTLKYYWRFNGGTYYYGTAVTNSASTNYAVSTSSSLNIPGVTVTNAGTYTVTVSNNFGAVTSSNASLSIIPYIITAPSPTNMTPQSSATFSLVAAADQPLVYQWYFTSNSTFDVYAPITGATDASYTNTFLPPGDIGYFSVVASNFIGGLTSAPAMLTILEAPRILVQPSNQAVLLGSAFSFSVTADGTPPLSYQWRTNGIPIPGEINSVFSRLISTAADALTYDVVVTNTFAGFPGLVTSDPATLTFASLPAITAGPSNVNAAVGAAVSFSVSVTGSPPLFYQWFFNGTNLVAATNSSYFINSATSTNAGTYWAVVTNPYGSVTSSPATLIVKVPPSITTQPTNVTTRAGSNVTFTAAASGDPPLYFLWSFNGSAIPGATSPVYSVTNVQASNAGSYVLIVTNLVGAATSSPAVLSIIGPPIITGQPISQTVRIGSNATFVVTATGAPAPAYQWRFNGANIAGATDSSFTLNNVQTNNAGNYSAVVTNSFGSATSAVATLTVTLAPPTIIAQPTNQSVLAGSNATFSIVATGSQPLFYQWGFSNALFRPETIDGPTNIFGATNASFTLTNAQPTNAGNYCVMVSNSTGIATSAVATLTVLIPPSITLQPSNKSSCLGDDTVFSVQASGIPAPGYQWYFNGTNLLPGTSSSYTVAGVQSNSAGAYSAVASNSLGSVTSAPALLSILGSHIVIATPPTNQTVALGGSAYFGVTANGAQPLTYQWELGYNPIGGATNSYYSIASAQANDAGTYVVLISNPCGSVQSAEAILTVNVPPSIANQPVSQTVTVGGTVSFDVSASGTPPLSYQWRFKGLAISSATDASYSLNNVQTNNAGNYDVVVANSAGSVTSVVATLTVVPTYTVSGRALDGTNALAGVSIVASPGGGTLTDTSGHYSITNLAAGNYSLTASYSNYVFNGGIAVPVSVPPSTNGVDFVASGRTYTVSGSVSDCFGPLSGVQIYGGQTTAFDGSYSLTFSQSNGIVSTNTLIPVKAGYVFSPSNFTVVLPPSQTNINFAGSRTDIILDDTDPAVTFVGAWQSTSSSHAYNDYYHFIGTAAGGQSSATYRPTFCSPGHFDLYLWYPQSSGNATNALWSVAYSGGVTNIAVNQTINGGGWVRIASGIPFDQGSNGYVRLSNDTGFSGRSVVADGVRFVFRPASAPGPCRTPPNFESIHILPDHRVQLQLSVACFSGNYAIDGATNLSSWQQLTNFVATNSPVIFIDAETNHSQRFYRARLIP